MAKRLTKPTFLFALSQKAQVLAGCLLFVAITVLARLHDAFPGDAWALQELRQLRTGWLDGAAVAVSTIGGGGIGWWLAVPWVPLGALAVGLAARRWGDVAFLAAAACGPLVNFGIKEMVARPRPDVDLWLVMETGFSFPSGHAVFVAAFLGAVILLTEESGLFGDRAYLRRIPQGVLALCIVAVGASRVYLGVHWPSDVIAGFLFGGLYLYVLVVVRGLIENWRHIYDR